MQERRTKCKHQSLQAVPELVDQNIYRIHIISIELLVGLEFGRHMRNSLIKARLEITGCG